MDSNGLDLDRIQMDPIWIRGSKFAGPKFESMDPTDTVSNQTGPTYFGILMNFGSC